MEEPGEDGQRAERAPLASEEGMEVSPTLAEKEIIGGNEFKVKKVYNSVLFDPITNMY